MKFYTYAQPLGNSILYRGYENGRQIIEKLPFSPTLYITSKNPKSEWKSLYDNKPLDPVEFGDIKEAKNFVETYKDVQGIEIHGFQRWQYQFINKEFPNEFDYDLSQVNILTLDIEVVSEDEDGFPDIQSADTPIVLISMHSSKTNKTIVLGIKDYISDKEDDFEYKLFSNEKEMLKYFIAYNKASRPDIWTGWNTSQFDIPYIVNRIMRLFDEQMVKQLSPFGYVREKTLNIRGRDVQTYDILGVIDLDYLELYKKFGTYSAKESYALGFIAQEELGHSKVDLPGSSFRDNYNNYFQTFVKYSAIDTVLVEQFEKKMKLIELAFAMAYMYRCNLQDIYRTVAPWEVFIYNHLSKKKIAVPPKRKSMNGSVEGAWVKEPKPGMYGWTMSFDFSSLYPSVVRQWNISPETFIQQEFDVRAQDFLNNTKSAVENIKYGKDHNFVVGANGAMFRKDMQGFFPELMEYCMVGRKKAKKEMLALESEYQKTKDDSLLPKISSLNNKQMALKIAANAAYGAIGNEGFHYYEYRIAEAITITGQLSNMHLADAINKKVNKILKSDDIDYIIYGDTDSLYLNCDKIVETFVKDKSRDEIIIFLDKFAKQVCQPVIDSSINAVYDEMNCYDKVMDSKREAIASKVLFRGKKNYAMYVHNSEGVDYKEPKLKVMGIEIVRSSTPQWCRKALKKSLMMIFETSEESFRENFDKNEKEFKKLPPEEIAFPRGVSDIDKWFDNGKIKKGCPMHVRAALLFNLHTSKYPGYQQIQNGDKIKFVYLKLPNPIKENVIGIPAGLKLPKELGLDKYVDYTTQFEKTFEMPLRSLTDCAGWHVREVSSLEGFFG